MNEPTKMMRVLAAITCGTSFQDVAHETGIGIVLIRNYGPLLKARGLVVRDNPGLPNCEIATYSITSAGRELLAAQFDRTSPSVPLVQAGIASRPVLAKVWQGACA